MYQIYASSYSQAVYSPAAPCAPILRHPLHPASVREKNHKHSAPRHYINIERGHSLCPESDERFMHPNRLDQHALTACSQIRRIALPSSFHRFGTFYNPIYVIPPFVKIHHFFISQILMFYYHCLKRAIKILWEIGISPYIFVRFYRTPEVIYVCP